MFIFPGIVNCVSFNDEGTVIMSGSTDNSIKAWDCRSRGDKPIQVCFEMLSCFLCCRLRRTSIITLSHNSRTVTRCGLFKVICMTCVPDRELTNISQCEVSYLLQWSVQTLDDAKDSVVTLEVTDHEILAGSADSRVRRYDIRNGQLQVDYIGRMTFVL